MIITLILTSVYLKLCLMARSEDLARLLQTFMIFIAQLFSLLKQTIAVFYKISCQIRRGYRCYCSQLTTEYEYNNSKRLLYVT